MANVPTPDALREILATILTGAAGGTVEQWHAAIGEVEKLPVWKATRSNWAVHPTSDADTIQHAVDIVRAEHPYVAG